LAVERLKFRCYQCNQLLAAAPGKVGTVVSCPKCKADLLVPAPEPRPVGETEPRSSDESSSRIATTPASPKRPSVPTFLDEIAAALPAEVADLRPEDLRVEAEFFKSLTRAPEPPRIPDPFPVLAPQPSTPFPSLEPRPELPQAPPPWAIAAAEASPASARRPEAPDLIPPLAATAPKSQASPDAPPIEIETPTILPRGREIRPIREVVLPASAALAWSLFALFAIATSFIAGLMIGHYVLITH